jgi:hypothetical protein
MPAHGREIERKSREMGIYRTTKRSAVDNVPFRPKNLVLATGIASLAVVFACLVDLVRACILVRMKNS